MTTPEILPNYAFIWLSSFDNQSHTQYKVDINNLSSELRTITAEIKHSIKRTSAKDVNVVTLEKPPKNYDYRAYFKGWQNDPPQSKKVFYIQIEQLI